MPNIVGILANIHKETLICVRNIVVLALTTLYYSLHCLVTCDLSGDVTFACVTNANLRNTPEQPTTHGSKQTHEWNCQALKLYVNNKNLIDFHEKSPMLLPLQRALHNTTLKDCGNNVVKQCNCKRSNAVWDPLQV